MVLVNRVPCVACAAMCRGGEAGRLTEPSGPRPSPLVGGREGTERAELVCIVEETGGQTD